MAEVGLFAGTCCCGGFTGLLDCRGTGEGLCPNFQDRGLGICSNPCIPLLFLADFDGVGPGPLTGLCPEVATECCGEWNRPGHVLLRNATTACSWDDRHCDDSFADHPFFSEPEGFPPLEACSGCFAGDCFERNLGMNWTPQIGGGVIFTISTDDDGTIESVFEKTGLGDINGQIDCQNDPLGVYSYTTDISRTDDPAGPADFDSVCGFSGGATVTLSDPSGFDLPCEYCT